MAERAGHLGGSGSRSGYRNKDTDSSYSDNSDEDTQLWRQKKQKYFRQKETDTERVQGLHNDKRKNNVWGSVLQEQDLTQTLKSSGVDKPEDTDINTRDVESYDFTKKYQDTRPDLPDSDEEQPENITDPVGVLPSMSAPAIRQIIDYNDALDNSAQRNRRGRKRKAEEQGDKFERKMGGVHDRLGMKKVTTTRLGEITLSEDMEPEQLAKGIAEFIHEPKIELIERVITNMGKAVALRILLATKDVEEGGGMYINDGSRRRTPGGVYLQLLKQQPEYSKDMQKLIFLEDWEDKKLLKKEKRKRARQRDKEKKLQIGKHENLQRSRSNSNSKSRSRSNSKSRSVSRETKKEQTEEMEEGEINSEKDLERDIEESESKSEKDLERNIKTKSEKDWYKNGKGKSRRNRGRRDNTRHRGQYNDYDRQEESEDSEDDKPRKPQAYDFERELELARKRIQDKKKAAEGGGKQDGGRGSQGAGKEKGGEEMGDLEEAESNVVDVPLDM
ncbi:PHAX-like protein [Mya arenaria]|uniref:Phosphorylated adapter RNA export protein n=1 Tax=Mya arenaria TaxID=6604 RepID=A0ABY7DS89_MYAAR|nr:phosphorylated adapter RNA export protein-like [Mya arenaria]WAQ97820.1 PHAX-like protein [Mya arenaria]